MFCAITQRQNLMDYMSGMTDGDDELIRVTNPIEMLTSDALELFGDREVTYLGEGSYKVCFVRKNEEVISFYKHVDSFEESFMIMFVEEYPQYNHFFGNIRQRHDLGDCVISLDYCEVLDDCELDPEQRKVYNAICGWQSIVTDDLSMEEATKRIDSVSVSESDKTLRELRQLFKDLLTFTIEDNNECSNDLCLDNMGWKGNHPILFDIFI